ncbi:hypothetical protein IKF30_01545 [Candidatus Saccharibacteria bacterium]|nr:hypothetical protein [Candidatus Saccharibacteria bacterium]
MKTKTGIEILLICSGIIMLSGSLANKVSATSMNLSIDSSDIVLNLASTSLDGSFGESPEMTIAVSTDNPSGYTLSIASPNGTSLNHANDSTKSLLSLESETTTENFSGRGNTSYNNRWGYRPNKINGANNTNFLPAPSAEGDIIDTVWRPNDNANEYTVSVGARINSETAAGRYSNTFIIAAVPNIPVLTVIYDGNGLYYDGDSMDTSNAVIYDAGSTIVDGATVYTKTVLDGLFRTPTNPNYVYKFRGWSEDPNDIYGTYADEAAVISDLPKVNGDPTVTLYAIWSRVYTLQYDGNGADNVDGMGITNSETGLKTVYHSNVARGDTFDLFASNFKREGYGFAGWSLDADAWEHLTDNDSTNDPEIYGPNEMIIAPAYQADIMTLNAVWVPAETDGGERVMLQNWTGCPNLTPTTYDSNSGKLVATGASIIALTDERDDQIYAVARLADENCWLIENLRIDNTAELSIDNTNVSSANSSLPLTNVYNSDISLAVTSNFLSQPSSANSFSDYSFGWCSQYSVSCIDQSRLNTSSTNSAIIPNKTQTIDSVNQHADFGVAFSYGNYYNWYSSTAGYGTYSVTSTLPTVGDICPAGWHLPYGSDGNSELEDIGMTSGGFAYLSSQMGGSGSADSSVMSSNKWRAFPNNYVYSGYINNGSANSPGGYGAYWSSSALNSNSAYNLRLMNNYVGLIDSSSKYLGLAVRCVKNTQ